MIDLLEHWRRHSIPRHEPFRTAPGLTDKVAGTALRPYEGNTVVFTLQEDIIAALGEYQEALYARGGEFLAEKISPETFHVTLHDLISGPAGAVPETLDAAGKQARELLSRLRAEGNLSISAEATCMFNMAHTSIVLGIRPKTATDHVLLDGLFGLFQTIPESRRKHDYTPHITLAYFRPGVYDPKAMGDLEELLGKDIPLSLTLSTDRLVYQTFGSMDAYQTVF